MKKAPYLACIAILLLAGCESETEVVDLTVGWTIGLERTASGPESYSQSCLPDATATARTRPSFVATMRRSFQNAGRDWTPAGSLRSQHRPRQLSLPFQRN